MRMTIGESNKGATGTSALTIVALRSTKPAAVFFLVLALASFSVGTAAQTTVNLTAPANNNVYFSPATVTLRASAATAVPNTTTRVEFYANGNLIGTDTTRAFSFIWTNPAPGTYTLTAIAYDSARGQATSAARSITVNAANQSPTVKLTSPANNASFALPATVTLKANATAPEDNDTVAKVDFFADGTLIGTDTSKAFTITWNPPAGTFALTAVATDGQGAQTTSAVRTVAVAANQSPTVNLTSPANNSSFAPPATITLKANATPPEDNDTVARVDFFANGTLIGTDTSKAFSVTWTNPSPGSYTLTAVATDGHGAQTTSSPRTVKVDAANLPPTVNLTLPANKAVFNAPAAIALKANASAPEANDAVARVDFFDGTTLVGTATAAPYTTTIANAAAGTHVLTAVATDGQGAQTTSAARTVTVNPGSNLAPTIALISPASGASFSAPATIALAANASDADGTIARVDFYQGTIPIGTVTSAPYTFTWTNVGQGSYAVTAVATDSGGAIATSAPVNITVNSGVAQMYYIVPDHLNTPRLIQDQAGTPVWRWDRGEPFGNDVPNNNPTAAGAFDFPLRFPGQYFDEETGLSQNWNRDYHSSIGRYLEVDPIGLAGGLNLYIYSNGDPLRYVDPEGKVSNVVLCVAAALMIYSGKKLWDKYSCQTNCELDCTLKHSCVGGACPLDSGDTRALTQCKGTCIFQCWGGMGRKGPMGPTPKSPPNNPPWAPKSP
jgi:RHS repeat-associated protein